MFGGLPIAGRPFAVYAVLIVMVLTLVRMTAAVPPQPTCGNTPSATTQSAVLKVKKSDNACTVTDGGYVRLATTYHLHAQPA